MKALHPSRALPFRSLPLLGMLVLSAPAWAGSQVTLSQQTPAEQAAPAKDPDDNSDAWHRKLWTGSFDKASDASAAAAKQLDGLDFGDCQKYLQPQDGKLGNSNLYWACVQRKQASANYAAEARSISKQQNVMSVISKASDVAAVGAVAGVAYAEIGVKQGNQAGTYQSAANIQRMAGTAAYATGATDLAMGAYAYAAQKQKLEQMQSTISGASNGVKADVDPGVASALANAAEAAKKAAYAHMMWGAGKLAAGYGMMYLAKKSEDQAARMGEIQADQDMLAALQAQQAAGGSTSPTVIAAGSSGGAAPVYNNNNPTFTFPSGTGGSTVAPGVTSFATNGSGGSTTGGSAPISGLSGAARSPASAGGGLSGGGAASPGKDDAKTEAEAEPVKEKTAKEALGGSFEMQLTGGMRSYSGNGSSGGGKDEVPNIASLMGPGDANGGKMAATGLSPTAMYETATEGTEGREQGSMAGVNGKSETSLFVITKAKLTKMFQVGNVGIPKNVEVKN